MPETDKTAKGLMFPMVVKPQHESSSFGLKIVHNEVELDKAVDDIVKLYQQEALVEEYVDGREFCVGILPEMNMR